MDPGVLNYSTMKNIMERFNKFDYEGCVDKEITQEIKANWKDYLEDNPGDWSFLLTSINPSRYRVM